MSEIRAISAEGVTSQSVNDGAFAILQFQRTNPDPNGGTMVNVALPMQMMFYVAVAALNAIPKPDPGLTGHHPFVLAAQQVQLGRGPNGQIIFTVELEQGARLSFELDQGQADSLAAGFATVASPVVGKPSGPVN
jgi:hypothetical protein